MIGVYCRHSKKNYNDIFNVKLDGTIKKLKITKQKLSMVILMIIC